MVRHEEHKVWHAIGRAPAPLDYQRLVEAVAVDKAVLSNNGDIAFLSWPPLIFDRFSNENDTWVDSSKIDHDKLASMVSDEEKMDYLIEMCAFPVKMKQDQGRDFGMLGLVPVGQ